MIPLERSLRPFYFTVVFWGPVYREYFTDLLLASLLSPNNIPALKRERNSKFLIVTTRADWDALQDHDMFRLLKTYVEPVWFEMPFPASQELKMLVMSKGHKAVSSRCFEDGAYGVYVTPDLVLSDGSVAAMERLAAEGKKVVLCVAIRFRQESLLEEMEKEGYLKTAQPLILPPRDLMRMALRNLHSETLRYEFEAPYFADSPISVYWHVPSGDGLIIHSFSWAPLVVDYGALATHDTRTFEDWTLDGDYIYRNFPDYQDVYVVSDSDEISLVSFTKETDLHFDLVPDGKKSLKMISEPYKISLLRNLRESWVMDPLKRSIIQMPVFLHSREITDAWHRTSRRTNRLVLQACRPASRWETFPSQLVEQFECSRFARHVVQQTEAAPSYSAARRLFLWYFVVWLCVVKPWRFAYRMVGQASRQASRPFSALLWIWRFRRFVWWRLKEKLGVVQERHFDWRSGGWDQPDVSSVCPLFTTRWLWRYRRFVWWRLKEKLGVVQERHFDWRSGGWDQPGVSFVCPLYTTRWLWRYRRCVWWGFKQRFGYVEGAPMEWDDPEWQALISPRLSQGGIEGAKVCIPREALPVTTKEDS